MSKNIFGKSSIIKDMYSEYIVLFRRDGKYYAFNEYDNRILDYIEFNGEINFFKDKMINFVVLDDEEVLCKGDYGKSNNYKKYYYLACVKER